LRARQLLFPGSSAVEQPAVNRLVAGSNPARGANACSHLFTTVRSRRKTVERSMISLNGRRCCA
jgi:hypothetical protein